MEKISEMLKEAKASVKQMQKNHKFKKANKERDAKSELQYNLGLCRGKLENCKNQFKRTIRTQSQNIAEGRRQGIDTLIEEQILWDAAIGYLLVRDAIYSLNSVTSYDSVAHAYDLLDAATKQISGKTGGISKLLKRGNGKTRNEYGYVTSDAAVKQKVEYLDTFFDELVQTGDIEACMQNAGHPANVNAARRKVAGNNKSTGGTGGKSMVDKYLSEMDDMAGDDWEEEIEVPDTEDVLPPTTFGKHHEAAVDVEALANSIEEPAREVQSENAEPVAEQVSETDV